MTKSFSFLTALLLVACTAPYAADVERIAPRPVDVVGKFPHDRGAFTQGLVIADGRLFESTGQYGESVLREVVLETGEVLREHRLADHEFGEGLTVHDGRLVQLTWRNGIGYIHDLENLERTGSFRYLGEGWGLTTDGDRLIMSDGTANLRFLDPVGFRETGRLRVTLNGRPLRNLNALQYRDGRVLANIWRTTHVAEIDPTTGRVVALHDLAPLLAYLDFTPDLNNESLNGLALNPETGQLYATGKYWPWLFEIRTR